MPKPQDTYTPLQEYFLVRVARLAVLYREYKKWALPPDEDSVLVCWALRCTMVDCIQLGIGPEAHALLTADDY